MMAKQPHLALTYDNSLPETLFIPFATIITAPGLDVVVERRPQSGPYAGIRWLLPTAVVIYIARSYFDGFLKEVGKEHYVVLKRAIGSLWSTFFGDNRAVRWRAIATPGKLRADHDLYSLAISIVAESGKGLRFKLLIEDASTAEEFNLAVATFFGFLESHYAGRIDPATQAQLASTSAVGKTILATYDKAHGVFKFIDPLPPKVKGQWPESGR